MGKIVTYLEMTGREELTPGRAVPGMELRREEGLSALVRSVQARVGAAYGWRSSSRTDQQWTELARAHPHRQYWLVELSGTTAGIAALEPQAGGEVEIVTFGLLPEYVGQGLGGHALTLALRQAWATEPFEAESVRRVWLHTDSNDHPTALGNYLRRGLRVHRTESVEGA
ncbi:GNAT family N-acetyltransferase [Kitasatospora sp. NPDC001603]|uniref:GNAT family N-acetyltransferase n=1 Tax=Kitasatospora sp. NPDC001603 TaxID=3154388 RepID=UPI003330EB64